MDRETRFLTVILRLGPPPPPPSDCIYTTDEWFTAFVNLWHELGMDTIDTLSGVPYDVEDADWSEFWRWWKQRRGEGAAS